MGKQKVGRAGRKKLDSLAVNAPRVVQNEVTNSPPTPAAPAAGKGEDAAAPAEDMRSVTFDLNIEAVRQLKILAAEEDTNQKDLFVEALNLLFKMQGKPQIARAR